MKMHLLIATEERIKTREKILYVKVHLSQEQNKWNLLSIYVFSSFHILLFLQFAIEDFIAFVIYYNRKPKALSI